MALPNPIDARSLSVTDAAGLGVAAIVRDASQGKDVLVTRRGQPVAYVVGVERMAQISELESTLRDSLLVLSRVATDTGERTSLDDVISAFGYTRAELEAELAHELATE